MVAYAMLIGVIKFSLVFFSISAGMPAGVAGLVLQVQVMFSVFLAALLFREWPKPAQLIGLTIAFLGVCVIAWGQYQEACFTSMLLLIIAAFAWSLSNFVLRQAGGVNMMHFMAWMSLVPPVPLLLLSAMVEGVDSWVVAWGKVDGYAVILLLYLSLIATVMAFGFWGMLMARYPTAQVAPFSLLVPVFGMTSASVMLGECYSAASFWGGMIALVGLAVNVLAGKRVFRKSSS
jgi:O-acetylserine/cysteine efflux transporter